MLRIYEKIRRFANAKTQTFAIVPYKKYKDNFLKLVSEKPKKFIGDIYQEDKENPGECKKDSNGNVIRPVSYTSGAEIICCPEPIEFISEFNARQSIWGELINGGEE